MGLRPTASLRYAYSKNKPESIMPARKASQSSPLRASAQRFREARQELQQLDYCLKGTVLKRMMKCGQAQCACHSDPFKRHGPYFEWTYKAQGKTVNVRLSPQAAPIYQAAAKQHRKLKAILARMERLSRAELAHLAKQADRAD
jgi:type II secretory pathway component PulJ